MMAEATSCPFFAERSWQSSGRRGSMRTIGIGKPITPVEQTATSLLSNPNSFATILHSLRATTIPSRPVQALALPLLTTTARMSPLLKCSLLTLTQAAFTRFVVNVPALVVGRVEYTSPKSSLVAVGVYEVLRQWGYPGLSQKGKLFGPESG